MRVGAVWRMQMHFTVPSVINPSRRRTLQSRGTDGLDFYLRFLDAGEIKTFFCCGDEIYLKQGKSNKATLGNTSISFSKLLFSHAEGSCGGGSLQVKCNHPSIGLCSVLNNNNISLGPWHHLHQVCNLNF